MYNIEWIEVDEQTAIRQGDLLIKRNPRDKKILDRLIAITADCDFAQTKTGGALAALRVLPLEDYVRRYWSSKHAEKLLNDQKELIASFNKLTTEPVARSPLSGQAIESWISRTSATTIVAQLGLTGHKAEAKVILIIDKLKSLSKVFSSAGQHECLDEIIKYYGLKDQAQYEIARDNVLKKIRSDLGSLPDDTFLLNTLGEEFQNPHVVLLRNLVFVGLDEATISAEVARSQACYLRSGRLSPTFKYAISQQFGLLYSRIGLPAEYDRSKKTYTSTFVC